VRQKFSKTEVIADVKNTPPTGYQGIASRIGRAGKAYLHPWQAGFLLILAMPGYKLGANLSIGKPYYARRSISKTNAIFT
jgi:hypothetical protein